MIDFTDFLPTLTQAVGAPTRSGALRRGVPADLVLDGHSFLPQLRGEKGHPREWTFCHYFRNPGDPVKRFARDKRWKLYQNGDLFDLIVDPLEEHPIPARHESAAAAAVRGRLRSVLDTLR